MKGKKWISKNSICRGLTVVNMTWLGSVDAGFVWVLKIEINMGGGR